MKWRLSVIILVNKFLISNLTNDIPLNCRVMHKEDFNNRKGRGAFLLYIYAISSACNKPEYQDKDSPTFSRECVMCLQDKEKTKTKHK